MAQSMGRLLEIMTGMKRLQNILSGAMIDDQDTHMSCQITVYVEKDRDSTSFLFVCVVLWDSIFYC